jgi:hypothetical protein
MKSKLRAILLCVALHIGVTFGVPMCPEEIQELMRRIQRPKIAHTLPDASDSGDRAVNSSVRE